MPAISNPSSPVYPDLVTIYYYPSNLDLKWDMKGISAKLISVNIYCKIWGLFGPWTAINPLSSYKVTLVDRF